MGDREMLGQGSQVGVVATRSRVLGPLHDRFGSGAIVTAESELVEKLPHHMAEFLALAYSLCRACKRLGQPLRVGWITGKPIGAGCKRLCHREENGRASLGLPARASPCARLSRSSGRPGRAELRCLQPSI